MKTVEPLAMVKQPPGWYQIARLLVLNEANLLALFGGAIRDTELNKPVNDYDVRVWMEPGETRAFLSQLRRVVDIEEVPSAGTGKIRYCFSYLGYKVDLSIRPIPVEFRGMSNVPIDAVARERAGSSDAGLCSVALDPVGRGFATPEYLVDETQKTITMYPDNNSGRLEAYASRMQNKFPQYSLVWKEIPCLNQNS